MRRYIYDHYGQRFGTPLVGDVDSVLAWVLTFVGIDFAYYWFHRGASVVESRALRASPSLTAPSPLPATPQLGMRSTLFGRHTLCTTHRSTTT